VTIIFLKQGITERRAMKVIKEVKKERDRVVEGQK